MNFGGVGVLAAQIVLLLTVAIGPVHAAGATEAAIAITGASASGFETAAFGARGTGERGLPTLGEFSQGLVDQGGSGVAGVYVPGVLALRVLAQPSGNPGYVTSTPDAVSQFGMAESYGTVGLLAHNHLTGAQFFSLEPGQTVIVLHADGGRDHFRVETVHSYQALSPTSAVSDFLELGDDGRRISALQLFNKMYAAGDQLVFQTCIERAGNPYWGRLFVVATPIEATMDAVLQAKMPFVRPGSAPLSF